MVHVPTAFSYGHSVIHRIDLAIGVPDSYLGTVPDHEKEMQRIRHQAENEFAVAMGRPEIIAMLRKTLGWAASLALVYVAVSSLPDVIPYIKISRM